jgi:hypothetical protein
MLVDAIPVYTKIGLHLDQGEQTARDRGSEHTAHHDRAELSSIHPLFLFNRFALGQDSISLWLRQDNTLGTVGVTEAMYASKQGCMKVANLPARTRARSMWMIAAAALIELGAGCGNGTTEPLIKCNEPPPENRPDGTWRGQLGGRELAVTLTSGCALVFIYPTWLVGGTWTWGGVSSGTASFEGALSLAANPTGTTFRGLTIRINETPPYHSVLTGQADGELPLTASVNGAWQTFSKEPVTLTRQ